jgi:hypothetical protein
MIATVTTRSVSMRFAIALAATTLIACGDEEPAPTNLCTPGQGRVCMTDAGLGLHVCTRDGFFSEECFLDDECNVLEQTGCPEGRYCFLESETICAPDGVLPCPPGFQLMYQSREGPFFCRAYCDRAGHPDGIDPEHCPEGLYCQATSGVSDDIGLCGIEGNE